MGVGQAQERRSWNGPWRLAPDPDADLVQRFEVTFPRHALSNPDDLPEYVQAQIESRTAILKSKPIPATEDPLYVSEDIFSALREDPEALFVQAVLSKSNVWSWRWYRLKKSPTRLTSMLGFVALATGLVLSESLKVGEITPVWEAPNWVISATMITAVILQIAGIFLGFFKELINSDPDR